MIGDILPVAQAVGAVDQPYLLEARQMQALSLGVHIPLVCFGIAFPAMVLFTEWLYIRTGDPVYRTLAKRWSKVMLILFAIGVVTGTILSFELGLLWPRFMEQWGEVFGFAFAIEGLFFFLEAIFIAIYVYGWDRLSPRAHFLSGHPDRDLRRAAARPSVIAVNGWMNNPQGFDLGANGEVTDVRPLEALFNANLWHEEVHMYLAGFIVASSLVASRLRGRLAARAPRPLPPRRAGDPAGCAGAGGAGADRGRRLGRAHGRRGAADEAGGDRGPRRDHRRARASPSAASTSTARSTAG